MIGSHASFPSVDEVPVQSFPQPDGFQPVRPQPPSMLRINSMMLLLRLSMACALVTISAHYPPPRAHVGRST